jgi:hypothetical protein
VGHVSMLLLCMTNIHLNKELQQNFSRQFSKKSFQTNVVVTDTSQKIKQKSLLADRGQA